MGLSKPGGIYISLNVWMDFFTDLNSPNLSEIATSPFGLLAMTLMDGSSQAMKENV
jgi:hypothetical protein